MLLGARLKQFHRVRQHSIQISICGSDALSICLDHVTLVAMLNDVIELLTHMLLELALCISVYEIDAMRVRGLWFVDVDAVAVSGTREIYEVECAWV